MTNLKTKKPTTYLQRRRNVAILFFAIGILFMVGGLALGKRIIHFNDPNDSTGSPNDVSLYEIRRLKGFQNIQPVVNVEPQKESLMLQPLKEELTLIIDSLKQAGIISSTSVFFENFNRGEWMAIDGNALYHPASLMKVPLMLAVLKAAEASPGLLEHQIVYQKKPGALIFEQHFQGPSIEEGKSYKVHDLIFYSVANSDNHATHALATSIEMSHVIKMFESIQLPTPNLQDTGYLIGAKDFSRFMETIFNSTLLSPEYSEYGAEMMANCNFKEGFSKGLPNDVAMWHKFGEWTKAGEESELHESATIFLDGKPYLLTVMTRGRDLDALAKVLQLLANRIAKRTLRHGYGTARVNSLVPEGC